MGTRFRLVAIALGLSLLSGAAAAGQDASHWAQGMRSAVRLVAGERDAGGAWQAGVEIRLAPATVTYWRHPGDAGVPPQFRFDASANVLTAEVAYPAPMRLDEIGTEIFGYRDSVIFPVRVVPRDADRPVELVLNLDYAVCEKICIPAQAEARLILEPGSIGAEAARIKASYARVPVARPLAGSGPLAVLGVEGLGLDSGGHPAFRITVRAPAGQPGDLFAEAPAGSFIETAKAAPAADGSPAFIAKVVERPKTGGGSLDAVLTLVSGELAVETAVKLDLPAPLP